MPSSLYVPILLAGMLITGSSNSLWSKWQDMQCVENCDDLDPHRRVLFEQPVWQTLQMFVGEMLCFLPVIFTWLLSKRQSSVRLQSDSEDDAPPLAKPTSSPQSLTGWKVLLLWIPALCDLIATTLMNVGLLFSPVSVYQMVRGALVLFVGIFSVIFLRRRLWLYQWASLIIVILGVGIVGFSSSLVRDTIKDAGVGSLLTRALAPLSSPEPNDKPEVTSVLVGVFFVLFAQIFTATQFVVEEEIMGRYPVAPLVAVGYEGLFGAVTVLLLMPILALPAISSKSTFFDLPRGWHQMIGTPTVLGSSIAIAISISMFNFFGLSVTRHVSATARSLTDTCRTLSIWIISLGLGWEKLLFPTSLLQILGFSLLVYGTFLFNNLVPKPPCLPAPRAVPPTQGNPEEAEGLLSSPLEETATLPVDLGQSGYDVLPEGRPSHESPQRTRTD